MKCVLPGLHLQILTQQYCPGPGTCLLITLRAILKQLVLTLEALIPMGENRELRGRAMFANSIKDPQTGGARIQPDR